MVPANEICPNPHLTGNPREGWARYEELVLHAEAKGHLVLRVFLLRDGIIISLLDLTLKKEVEFSFLEQASLEGLPGCEQRDRVSQLGGQLCCEGVV